MRGREREVSSVYKVMDAREQRGGGYDGVSGGVSRGCIMIWDSARGGYIRCRGVGVMLKSRSV